VKRPLWAVQIVFFPAFKQLCLAALFMRQNDEAIEFFDHRIAGTQ
jgi:hypothetical protein